MQKEGATPIFDTKRQEVESATSQSSDFGESSLVGIETPSPDSTDSSAPNLATTTGPSGTQGTTSTVASSSQSSSSSSTAPEPVLRYGIRVVNNSAQSNLSTGYAISLEFDHAAIVSSGYRVDGSDLTVVSSVGGVDTSLPHALDPESAWGRANTKLWFSIPAPISAGQTIDSQFFLLFADPRFSGVERPKEVFLVYDSFDGDALDTNSWQVNASAQFGSSGQEVANGQLRIWSNGQDPGSYSEIQSTTSWQSPGVRMEARVAARGGATRARGGCSRERILSAWSKSDNQVRASIVQTQSSLYFEERREPLDNQLEILEDSSVDETPHHLAIDWLEEDVYVFQDQVFLKKLRSRGTFKSPDSTPMLLGVGTSALGDTCAGVLSELHVDWILARHLVTPEPTATLTGM